jgi:acyl-CoA synthetase (NDP forming)
VSDVIERFRPLFYPESIAVIGASASPQKWGFGILHNLVQGNFSGPLYPINPREKEIFGLQVYPSIEEVPGGVDLAMIVVPPEKVIPAVRSCGRKGVKAVVIITAGFGEVGPEEMDLQKELAREVNRFGMIAIGPNCQGVMSTRGKVFGQYIWIFPRSGSISIVSQSGNVGGSLIGKGLTYDIGFSKFVSSGNEAVTKCWDLMEYYGEDEDTSVIAAYIEGVSNGRAFIETLRKVTPKKPVVILKGGVTEAGGRACTSHTGVLAGESSVFNAACEQAGAVLVDSLEDLFYAAATFASQPLPRGNRVGIVTWGGGWGVLGTDACVREGLVVPALPQELIESMNKYLASRWSHNNPVDLASTQTREALTRTLELVIRSDAFDGVVQLGMGVSVFFKHMVDNSFYFSAPDRKQVRDMMVPIAEEMDRNLCERVLGLIRETGKPILGASDTAAMPTEDNIALKTLSREGKLIYPTPYHAARAMGHLARYAAFRKKINAI